MSTASSPSVTPQDYWNMVMRKKWLALAIFILSVSIAAVLCVVLPKSYRSSTLILVEDQKIPENYVKGIVGSNVEERLTMIQQQVMSRTLLSQVISEHKLYQEQVRKEGIESVVELVRKGIKVEMFGTPGPGARTSVEAFKISFAHENPVLAMKVTAKVASQFIEQNLKVREQLVEGASEFIKQELSLAKARLESQEQAISTFKTKYMGELPGQMEANLRALDRLQSDRTAITEGVSRLNDRLGMVEKAMKEYEATGITSPGVPVTPGKSGDPVTIRLIELERNLATLSAEYKENYPDIIATKQEIEKVKAQLAGRTDDGDSKIESKVPIDPYLRELHKQRDEIKIDIASLKERQVRLTGQMKDFEGRVERSPAREQELMILLRDYGNLQENYRTLLDKRLNARVAENLEKRQKGEQFRIIDPANLPQKPETPDVLKIMLMGLAIGCGLGVGAPIALEQFQPAFRKSEDVEALLGLPILASIPLFHTAFGISARTSTKLLGYAGAVPQPTQSVQGLYLGKVDHGTDGNGHKVPHNGAMRAWMRPWTKWKTTEAATHELPLGLNLVSKWRPWSVVTEQFRVAASRLTLMQGNRGSTVIIVTSAVKGEGKSAVAVNLGYVLARALGKSTLIIDADLKRPVVHGYMGDTVAPGLQDLLAGEQSVDACLHSQGELPLWVMPSGTSADQTIELSKINRLSEIISQLRGRFDYIILDAPPILPLADMHVLSGMADVVTMVIRAGITRQAVVQKALATLKPTTAPCIVLNGLQAEVVPYYMQEGYDYFAQKKELPRA
jgi:polysaccharide chain length determinant protein (PEP-CTERM system associated)